MANKCSIHHVPLEMTPAEPRSRCPNCHYMTHHLRFDLCPECGRRMEIEQPEAAWRCPMCTKATLAREKPAAA
jgi:DNA-directed RNA polymerase subunit RPC12/RpoP